MPVSAKDSERMKQIIKSAPRNYYGAGSGISYVGTPKQINTEKGVVKKPQLGAIGQFVDKAAKVGRQTADIVGMGGKKFGEFAVNTPKYVYRDIKPFLQGVASTVTGEYQADLGNIKRKSDQLDQQLQQYNQMYKEGKMTRDNYAKLVKNVADMQNELVGESAKIESKVDRGDVLESAAWTAATIIGAGKLKTASTGASGGALAYKTGGKQAIKELVEISATDLERAFMKSPAVRSLIERNTTEFAKRGIQQMAGENLAQFVAREGRAIATNFLFKRPLFYEQNIGDAKKIYEGIIESDEGQSLRSAAWLGIQMLDGGPLGVMAKNYNWTKGKIRDLSIGQGSFIDEVSRRTGIDVAGELMRLKIEDPLQYARDEKTWRVFQEMNLRMGGDDPIEAARLFLSNHSRMDSDLTQLTYKDITEEAYRHLRAQQVAKAVGKMKIKGYTKEQLQNAVVVRWDSVMKRGAAKAFIDGGAEGLLKHAQANGYAENKSIMEYLGKLIKEGGTPEEVAGRIKSVPTALTKLPLPVKAQKALANTGYFIAIPESGIRHTPYVELDDTRKLISAAAKGDSDLFDPAVAPQPVFAAVRGWAQRAGLSPESATSAAHRKLAESFVRQIDELGIARDLNLPQKDGDAVGGGQAILYKLQQYVEGKKPNMLGAAVTGTIGAPRAAITDIRQLTKTEIIEALNSPTFHVTKETAKQIQRSMMRAYLNVPLEVRGLGDRFVDALYAANPAHKYYSRIQSALKYAYNPFFRAQERVETALLTKMKADTPLIWNRSRGELDSTVKMLDEARIFSSSMAGEAAQDQVLGRLTANITKGQKRDLAGLALDMAKSRGVSIEAMLTDHQDELADALRVIVQYPQKGVLSSSLARTLNVAFFPMRYNAKVTMLTAQALAKQPPAVQKAVLHSVFSMKDWLKSDEGIQWQSDHADAIQLLKWITPINSIEYVFNLVNGVDSWGELGQLGGLPIGVLSQILDSQGIITLNTPYVQPQTGDVFPEYIPETTKARLSVAIADILGSMFNYPGRTLGLPGKASSIRAAVDLFIDTNGSDFEKRIDTERLTPLQKQWIKVLKGDMSEETLDSLYTTPAEGQFNWYTLPPTDLPFKDVAPVKVLPKQRKGRTKKVKPTALPMPS